MGGASFWKGSSLSPSIEPDLVLMLSSSSSRSGRGYFGYERSALADSGLEGGGLWTLTFLTGFFFWNVVLGGGGASLFPRDSRAFAKSPAECVGACGLGTYSPRSVEASASAGVESGGGAAAGAGAGLLALEMPLLRRKGL